MTIYVFVILDPFGEAGYRDRGLLASKYLQEKDGLGNGTTHPSHKLVLANPKGYVDDIFVLDEGGHKVL